MRKQTSTLTVFCLALSRAIRRGLRILHNRRCLRILTRLASICIHTISGKTQVLSLRLTCKLATLRIYTETRPKATAVCHVYYPFLLDELLAACERAPWVSRVLITCPLSQRSKILLLLDSRPTSETGILVQVVTVRNRGRDVIPFIEMLTHPWLTESDLVFKIHTKRSPHLRNGKGEFWRKSLLDGLAPHDVRRNAGLRRILATVASSDRPAVVWPARWAFSVESWGVNRESVTAIQDSNSASRFLPLIFPAGTMFWCNQKFLTELRQSPVSRVIRTSDLGNDALDGSIAHVLERYFGRLATSRGVSVLTL